MAVIAKAVGFNPASNLFGLIFNGFYALLF
jgi:hypothetical protein